MFLHRLSEAVYAVLDYQIENVGAAWLLWHVPSGQVVELLGQDVTWGELAEIIARDQAWRAADQ